MARLYKTKVSSRLWSMHCLHNVLDVAAINPCILHYEIVKSNISRKEFTLDLIEELKEQSKVDNNKSNAEDQVFQEESDNLDCSKTKKRTYCRIKNCNGSCRNRTNKLAVGAGNIFVGNEHCLQTPNLYFHGAFIYHLYLIWTNCTP